MSILRRVRRILTSLGVRAASYAERALLTSAWTSDRAQLFILGLPRSGTTLVYQYLVHRLKVAYFTNGVGSYPTAPCLITFLQSRLHGPYASDFESRYGKVSGPTAPREAGGFWGRFFGFEDYRSFEEVAPVDVQTMRRTIACVQQMYGNAPFVNKNVKHLLRIDALSKIFPQAYFLIVERNLTDVALSVLRGRHENVEDPRQWWSVKPPNYEELKSLPPVEQVAGQLLALRLKLTADVATLRPERILSVSYEAFCEHPDETLKPVREILGPIAPRNPGVQAFERSVNRPQTADEENLVDLIERAIGA